eukprot:4005030-Amphidinium_carterae.1
MAEITKAASWDQATLSAAIAQAAPKLRMPLTGKLWHVTIMFTQSEPGRSLAQLFQAVQTHAAQAQTPFLICVAGVQMTPMAL